MKNLFTLTFFALVGLGLVGCDGALEMEEGFRSSDQEIVGGSTFAGLPAVGAIAYNGRHHCTGTLISPTRVLTAAHCLDGFSPSRMLFVVGPSLSQAEEVIQVASVTPHPNYDGRSISNDIGYIDLVEPAFAQPMDIARNMGSNWVGRDLFFVGYGASDGFRQTGSGVKRAVTMSISQMGATQYAYADVGKNTCNGDSGGPAFYQDPATQRLLITGVTSFGDQNCAQFGVNTRADVFESFFEPPAPVAPVDPCGGETFEGRCDVNGNVVWCENEEIQSLACRNGCGFEAARGFFNCLN